MFGFNRKYKKGSSELVNRLKQFALAKIISKKLEILNSFFEEYEEELKKMGEDLSELANRVKNGDTTELMDSKIYTLLTPFVVMADKYKIRQLLLFIINNKEILPVKDEEREYILLESNFAYELIILGDFIKEHE